MVSNSGKVWLLLHSEQQQRGAWIFVKYPVQYFEIADTIERTSAKCSCAREFKFTIVKITPYLHHLSINIKFLQCANQCNVSTDKHHQLSRYLVDYTITHGLVNRSIQAPLRQQKAPDICNNDVAVQDRRRAPPRHTGGRNFHEAVVMSAAAGNRHTPNTRRNALLLLIKPYESD